MTFLVTLIALLIERFFDWSHLRHFRWYDAYLHFITRKISPAEAKYFSYLVLACAILPWLIVIGLIEHFLHGCCYGLIELLFELIILLYCLGPRNLWADAYACFNSLREGDPKAVEERLKATFTLNSPMSTPQTLHRHFLNQIFIDSNHRIFAPIFWFAVLGPVGVFLYRMLAITAKARETATELAHSSQLLLNLFDWIPVRILSFIFALGGHFVQVITNWKKMVFTGVAGNEVILTMCGIAALDTTTGNTTPIDDAAEKEAIGLLDRSFVIVLVLLAVGVLLL